MRPYTPVYTERWIVQTINDLCADCSISRDRAFEFLKRLLPFLNDFRGAA
ncbi:MAG: hypothetical protein QME27_05615 [Syntrophaceae bacterium]|mgnify:CR=1 FL=1|nr:hypothetical protein [Syntrophaceae bacterium]